MDRTTGLQPDGFGGRKVDAAGSAVQDQPYGPRTLGATTDPAEALVGAEPPRLIADQPYSSHAQPVQASAHGRGEPFGLDLTTPVQRLGGEGATADRVHTAATRGVDGPGQQLPHHDAIQAAFGPAHDVSGIQAHVGGPAAEATGAMGATAYATGDHVAFGSSPDPHTASHEAAHVVQQRGGVQLKGGVGQSGDVYERHADEVADAVVAGNSAAPILDRMAGGGGGEGAVQQRALQFLHGDLDAEVRPEIAAQNPAMAGKTVGEAAAGKSPRDANFNPARKVEFEVKLAAAILQNPGPAAAVVAEVSRRMLAYFDAKVAAGLNQADEDLRALGKLFAGTDDKPNTVFFGRLADSKSQLRRDIASEMRAVLSGGGTLTNQLFAHHQFIDQIWDKKGGGDFANNIVAKLKALAEQSGQNFNQQLENVAPKAFRKNADGQDRTEFAERGRFNPGEKGSRVEDTFGEGAAVPTTGDASGIAARPETDKKQSTGLEAAFGSDLDKPQGGEQAHQRGVDRLTMDESNAFVQRARLLFDMPLAGGISGTTTDLLEVATTFGIAGPQLHLYAVGVMGHLGSAGAHSFHEIAKAASFAGLPYQEGNYASFLPAAYMPIVQHLFDEYKDILNTAGSGGGANQEQAA